MKPVRSTRSVRSMRSTRSLRTSTAQSTTVPVKTELIDFENILPFACAKFNCPYVICVEKTQRNDDFYKALKQQEGVKRRISMALSTKRETATTPEPVQQDDIGSSIETATQPSSTSTINTVTVYSIYDTYNCLTEIRLERIKNVPRVMLKVMRYLVPYFKNLTRISIINSKINAAIIHEISNIVRVSTITQVHLDRTPVNEANYAIILDTSVIKSLSLTRCNINDDVCEIIASKLHMSTVGEKLSLLNLSSNHITDLGAKSLAAALRTNRCLRYLNIADNHITDDGAISILKVLMEFPLTDFEILNKKERYFTYLRNKQSLYLKYLERRSSAEISSKPSKRKKINARKEKESQQPSILNDDSMRAKLLAEQILGPFVDPFQADCIKRTDGHIYCIGNLALSHLNMSYNNLSYIMVKALKDVVTYQKGIRKVRTHNGLIKVLVDGNNLPIQCHEMNFISDLLGRKNLEFVRLSRGFSRGMP
ncbi:uncharacterized protein LOC110997324 [Pieris rapae]|uniref:uncharacterized protein LOC110997324 n=1 Tax=Pieris rapae TaxID=64459 RepID=UPI001E280C13|nr:uncharacterized protein LOC110997324 [Pieris rapae]